MKVYLDGIPVKHPLSSTAKPTIVQRRQDETGAIAFGFTGELVFVGEDYDYLYSKLVTDANALENKVTMKMVNDCCGGLQEYEFTISHKGLKWCEGSCEVKAVAAEKTTAEDMYTCLKNTMIWDDYAGFKSKQHPRITYCNELRPNWMHDVLILLSIATGTSILVFIPLIASVIATFNTINGILSWLNSNLGTSFNLISFNGQTQIDANTLNSYWNLLLSFIVGCGRKHPSPLVRDYATNVCTKCGLTFKSSIFDPSSDYHNLVYLNAPVHKGTLATDNTTYWIEENKPLLNGTKYFNELKSVFNAKYKIVGTDLVFERRDYFIPKTPWLDLTTYEGVRSVCWNWSEKTRYAYGVFYYQKDGINWVGNEARDRWGDYVDWNIPYSTLQKDSFEPLVPFTAARFRSDGIDRDVLNSYEWLPSIGPIIKQYQNTLLMNSHNSFIPMLLIWEPSSGISNAKVKTSYPNPFVTANQAYNFPMWMRQGASNSLYERFWAIENPKSSGFQGMDFVAEVSFDCDLLNLIDIDGTIKTSKGDAEIKEISINFDTNTLIITGTV